MIIGEIECLRFCKIGENEINLNYKLLFKLLNNETK